MAQSAGFDKVQKKSNWGRQFRTFSAVVAGVVVTRRLIGQEVVNKETDVTVENATACEDNEISKIKNALKSFTKEMNSVEDIGDLTIDPL